MAWHFNPRERRDPIGRWVSGLASPDSGFTRHPITGEVPSTGYQVGIDGHTLKINGKIPTFDDLSNMPEDELDRHFKSWLRENASAFADPNMHVGAWHEPGTNKIHFDLSEHVLSRRAAVRLGRQRNQVAIWDNAKGAPISTGGTGD